MGYLRCQQKPEARDIVSTESLQRLGCLDLQIRQVNQAIPGRKSNEIWATRYIGSPSIDHACMASVREMKAFLFLSIAADFSESGDAGVGTDGPQHHHHFP